MKNLLTLEKFTKQYQQKIDVKDFKKIKKGSKILYMGGQVEVLKNDGYVLTLKTKDGKKFTVNKSMFDHGGMIKEGVLDNITLMADASKDYEDFKKKFKKGFPKIFKPTPDFMDWLYGMYKDMAPDKVEEGIVKDLKKLGDEINYLVDADDDTKKIWKKAGFDTEDDDMVILYSYVSSSWPETKKLLDKKRVKYKELEDPNSAGESYIVFKESSQLNEGIDFQAILLKDAMLKYNIQPTGGIPRTLQFAGKGYMKAPKGTFLIGLPGGLFAVNMKKKFAVQLTSGSRAYLDAQDKLKDSDVGGTNMAPEFSQWKQYLNESITEARAKKVTKQMWKRMNDDKRFDALLSVVKDPDEAEEYVEYRWEELPSGFERDMVLFELSSAQDGTKDSDGKHKHEDHLEEDLEAMWKKTYGENFARQYPAVAKIIKQRKIKDKREIARIWQDTYGEDFEKEYPALYQKLS